MVVQFHHLPLCVKLEGFVGIQLGSEKIAALACAGRVKTMFFLNKSLLVQRDAQSVM